MGLKPSRFQAHLLCVRYFGEHTAWRSPSVAVCRWGREAKRCCCDLWRWNFVLKLFYVLFQICRTWRRSTPMKERRTTRTRATTGERSTETRRTTQLRAGGSSMRTRGPAPPSWGTRSTTLEAVDYNSVLTNIEAETVSAIHFQHWLMDPCLVSIENANKTVWKLENCLCPSYSGDIRIICVVLSLSKVNCPSSRRSAYGSIAEPRNNRQINKYQSRQVAFAGINLVSFKPEIYCVTQFSIRMKYEYTLQSAYSWLFDMWPCRQNNKNRTVNW